MTEQLANFGETTLAEALDSSEVTVTAIDGGVFPATGIFRVVCQDEIMVVSARTDDDLTVTRGAEGTTATTHANGLPLTMVLTAGGLDAAIDERIAAAGSGSLPSGTSFPPTPSTGDLFHRTDLSPAIWRFDGTRWRSEQTTTTTFPMTNSFGGVSATANQGRLPIPWLGTFGLYLLRFDWLVVPTSGHDASNYYTCKINWADTADSDTQVGATADSKTATAASNNYSFTGALNAVLDASARELKLRLDKVASSPNIIYSTGTITYQLIAT